MGQQAGSGGEDQRATTSQSQHERERCPDRASQRGADSRLGGNQPGQSAAQAQIEQAAVTDQYPGQRQDTKAVGPQLADQRGNDAQGGQDGQRQPQQDPQRVARQPPVSHHAAFSGRASTSRGR